MPESFPFGQVLARVREEQGYATPYAFFRSRGGRRGLGLTFANYLSLERGRSLPKGWRLKRLIEALELLPHSARGRELVWAYLVSVLGSEELLKGLSGPGGGDPAPNSWQLAETAVRQALGRTKVQLTLDQYKVLAENPAAYSCHVILCNTEGWVEGSELSRMTGLPPAAAAKALKALAGAGLARVSGGKGRSTLEENYVMPPAPTPAMAAVYAALQRHRASWLSGRGRVIHTPYLITRAQRSKMEKYLDHLTDAVNMSALYGDIRRHDDSEMFLIEARVARLFPPQES